MTLFPIILVLVSTVAHAAWNLYVHSLPTTTGLFLRVSLLMGFGLIPLAFGGLGGTPFPLEVWLILAAAGVFQGIYAFGLTAGYRTGNFTVVYPMARALPVLLLALFDLSRGRPPSVLGWSGMLLVTLGCLMAPLVSLRQWSIRQYLTPTIFWVFVIAIGTVGYSALDKLAAEILSQRLDRIVSLVGFLTMMQYGLIEFFASSPHLACVEWFQRRVRPAEERTASWRSAVIVAVMIVFTYSLVLWAYQMMTHASYVVALRQFSIVIGAVFGVILLREPAARLLLAAALLITLGLVCISFAVV